MDLREGGGRVGERERRPSSGERGRSSSESMVEWLEGMSTSISIRSPSVWSPLALLVSSLGAGDGEDDREKDRMTRRRRF